MNVSYAQYSAEKAFELLAIDSPSGFTDKCAARVKEEFEKLGFAAQFTTKGGVLVDFGGEDDNDALMLQAHIDTLGGMVAEVKSNGRLRITRLGGLRPENTEAENVRIYTRDGKYMRVHSSYATHPLMLTWLTATQSAALTTQRSLSTRM